MSMQSSGLARLALCHQRTSKIRGSPFAKLLAFGFLNQPEASYTHLQQMMDCCAIEERITQQAAALMSPLLQAMLPMLLSGQACSFDGLCLQDRTIVTLPDALPELCPEPGQTAGDAHRHQAKKKERKRRQKKCSSGIIEI